jgi:recombination protein RecA
MAISKDFMKNIRKEIGSVSFAESKYVTPSEWLDTGSYALNRIMSGDVYKGIPSGRVVIFGGENSTGKSRAAAQIVTNAIMRHAFDTMFYFDSEGGALYDFMVSQGCDMTKIEQSLVGNIEEATVNMLKTLIAIEAEKKENSTYKAGFILDSLGNLQPSKLVTDAVEKGKQVADQGGRARLCNQLASAITIPALKSDVPVILINTVFDDTQAMYKSKLLNQSGGKRFQHVGSIVLQCTKKFEKDEDKNKEQFYKGTTMTFFTTKNRFVKAFYEADIYLDFSRGMSKYGGLFDLAIRYGLIEQKGPWYEVNGKKYRRDDVVENEDVWKGQGLLDQLNEKSKKEMSYSAGEVEEMIKAEQQLEQEVK